MAEHVLLPLDPDMKESWRKALPEAIRQTRLRAATLHVMTVVPQYGSSIVATYFPADFEEKALEAARLSLHKLMGEHLPADLPRQLVVAHGPVYQEICRVAEEIEADLIVMASHKPAMHDRLLAPNAVQVLLHANTSVLILR